MRNITLLGLAVLASAATIAPALAVDATTVTSIVRTADLDLSSEEGRTALQHRIAQAAREVCGAPSNVHLEGRNAARQCRDETIAAVNAQREQLFAAEARGKPIVIAAR